MKRIVNDFLIVASPPDWVSEDVIFFKGETEDLLRGPFRSRHSVPHVTIHSCRDFHNESKLYWFEDIVSQTMPFRIFVDGFGLFKSNGTIYVRTVFDSSLRFFSKQLSGRSITPHITIARRLSPHSRDRVWQFFQPRHYSRDFLCEKISVLKRENSLWRRHVDFKLGKTLF